MKFTILVVALWTTIVKDITADSLSKDVAERGKTVLFFFNLVSVILSLM